MQSLDFMNWYYALGGQQKGPVSDMEFTTLVREGVILPTTLVWREGQPEWLALEKVRPELVAVSNAPVLGGVAVAEENKDVLVQQLREGAVAGAGAVGSATSLPYAGFWIRFGAKLIDGILMNIVFYAMGFMLFGSRIFVADPSQFENDPEAAAAFFVGYFGFLGFWMIAALAYNAVLVWKWGGTLGKLAVGIRVVDVDGKNISLSRSVGRAFADLLNGFACWLTYLMPAFDNPQKRALQDHICATRVVQK